MPRFSGNSRQGKFPEALRLAIAAAKDGLKSALVNWRLLLVREAKGDFSGQVDLTVEIVAVAP